MMCCRKRGAICALGIRGREGIRWMRNVGSRDGDRGLALALSGADKRIDDMDTVEFAVSLDVF